MFDSLDRAVFKAMRQAAERAILPRFRDGRSVAADYKSADEAVTAADRESEAILIEQLGPLIPGASIVGEETAHYAPETLTHLSSGTCWIIDPLDGTGNFVAGKTPFGILVALAVDGKPIGGWILDPVTGRMCLGRNGLGAMIDSQPFHITPMAVDHRPVVAITRLFADAERRATLAEKLARNFTVVDSPRCAADQYPRVAAGEHDATLFSRTIAWDHAAGVVFLSEAGGLAQRPDGKPYRCDRPDDGLIVASCPRRWEMIARRVDESGIRLAQAHLSAG